METSDREEKQMIYMEVTADMTREQVAELVLEKVGLKKEVAKKDTKAKDVKVAKLRTDCKRCFM